MATFVVEMFIAFSLKTIFETLGYGILNSSLCQTNDLSLASKIVLKDIKRQHNHAWTKELRAQLSF